MSVHKAEESTHLLGHGGDCDDTDVVAAGISDELEVRVAVISAAKDEA